MCGAAAALVALAGCGDEQHGDSGPPSAGTTSSEPGRTAAPTPPATVGKSARFRLRRIGVFNQPLLVTQAPGDTRRLFVVEKRGRVKVVRGGRVLRARS